jgi:hypothetical protein
MKTYCELLQQLNEAKAPATLMQQAHAHRDKVIETLRSILADATSMKIQPKDTIGRLKKSIAVWTNYNFNNKSAEEIRTILKADSIKNVKAGYTGDIKYEVNDLKKDAAILANPYTICDLLSDPKPNKFIDLIRNGSPDVSPTPRWMQDLDAIKNAFDVWFEAQGGGKMDIIRTFTKMISCKNRAPWAAWSGKGYRGVSRSTAVVKQYAFTGEVKKDGDYEWLVAKGTYKSRYGAQSWSDKWRTAEQFSSSNMGDLENPISVVFEVDLKKSETLLSADVIKKISAYGKQEEREVIRVGNAPIPVTVYVRVSDIEEIILLNSSTRTMGNKAKMYVYNRVVSRLGVKCADAFAKTKVFKQLVKDFT